MIILKILLIIILVILGLILLMLLMPVRVSFGYIGGRVSYSLKLAFVNIIDSGGGGLLGKKREKKSIPDKSKKRADKPEKKKSSADISETEEKSSPAKVEEKDSPPPKEESEESSDETKDDKPADTETEKDSDDNEADEEKGRSLGEKVDMLLGIWRCAKKPAAKIFKGFHFHDIMIDFVIANEDAYKCALNYGRISGAVYNLLAVMRLVFTSKEKTVDIKAGFAQEKSRWDISASVFFLPITAVISGIWFLITYIFRVYLPNRKNRKKSAVGQKSMPKGECEV